MIVLKIIIFTILFSPVFSIICHNETHPNVVSFVDPSNVGYCFNLFTPQSYSRDESRDLCKAWNPNADLHSVHSEEQRVFIRNIIQDSPSCSNAWGGLEKKVFGVPSTNMDIVWPDQFRWTDGSPLDFSLVGLIMTDQPQVCLRTIQSGSIMDMGCGREYCSLCQMRIPVCFGIAENDPTVCTGHGSCIDNDICICDPNYCGPQCTNPSSFQCGVYDCDDRNSCSSHGACIVNDNCECMEMWTGGYCENPRQCYGIDFNSPDVCSGRGNCTGDGTCNCLSGFKGDHCEITVQCYGIDSTDSNVCSNHGECLDDSTCRCHNEYGGLDCYYCWFNCSNICPDDPLVCSGHGICHDDNIPPHDDFDCICSSPNYNDPLCSYYCFGHSMSDINACNANGKCVDYNTCNCWENMYGNECEERIENPTIIFEDSIIILSYSINSTTMAKYSINECILSERFPSINEKEITCEWIWNDNVFKNHIIRMEIHGDLNYNKYPNGLEYNLISSNDTFIYTLIIPSSLLWLYILLPILITCSLLLLITTIIIVIIIIFIVLKGIKKRDVSIKSFTEKELEVQEKPKQEIIEKKKEETSTKGSKVMRYSFNPKTGSRMRVAPIPPREKSNSSLPKTKTKKPQSFRVSRSENSSLRNRERENEMKFQKVNKLFETLSGYSIWSVIYKGDNIIMQEFPQSLMDDSNIQDIRDELSTFNDCSKVNNSIASYDDLPSHIDIGNVTAFLCPNFKGIQSNIKEYAQKNIKKTNIREITRILMKVSQAIQELHKNGTSHLDICGDTIFVTKSKEIKVGFGFNKFLRINLENSIFVPKELINAKYKDAKSIDSYSIGVLGYCLLYNKWGIDQLNNGYLTIKWNRKNIPNWLKVTINSCLSKISFQRPSVAEISTIFQTMQIKHSLLSIFSTAYEEIFSCIKKLRKTNKKVKTTFKRGEFASEKELNDIKGLMTRMHKAKNDLVEITKNEISILRYNGKALKVKRLQKIYDVLVKEEGIGKLLSDLDTKMENINKLLPPQVIFSKLYEISKARGIGKKKKKYLKYFGELDMKTGQKHGIGREFHSNGKMKFFGTFKYGKRVGVGEEFDEEGKVINRAEWLDDTIQLKTYDFNKLTKELRLSDKLGGGSYASVYKITLDGRVYAIKIMEINQEKKEQIEDFYNEVKLLANCRHPNVIKVIGWSDCKKTNQFGYIMEYGPKRIHSMYDKFSFDEKLKILLQVGEAMKYLHDEKNILHRDLKWDNVLLTSYDCVKVIDFGLSKKIHSIRLNEMTTARGTPNFIAPEVLNSSNYTNKCDVFSFSIMMYCLYNNTNDPYNLKESHYSKALNIGNKVANGLRPNITEMLKVKNQKVKKYLKLMTECWNTDPDLRPTFSEVCDRIELIFV